MSWTNLVMNELQKIFQCLHKLPPSWSILHDGPHEREKCQNQAFVVDHRVLEALYSFVGHTGIVVEAVFEDKTVHDVESTYTKPPKRIQW